jgi:hypothetical protein
MTDLLELILNNFSVDDIISYAAQDIKHYRTGSEDLSALEKITKKSFSKQEQTDKKEKITEETSKSLPKEDSLANISYELFIPVSGLESYTEIDMTLTITEKRKSLEIELEKGKNKATLEIEKAIKENSAYSIMFSYDKKRQGYFVRYETKEYKKRIDKARQDFTNTLDKSLEILPKSLMGGVLGFTYLGSGKMTRREDLFGAKALMVDVHEAIHTPDEYETRVLTSWMLKMEKPKYKR